MSLRFALSNLTKPEARQTAARWLLVVCATGFLVTMVVLVAAGITGHGWLFILFAWVLFVYLPLRILLETFHAIGPHLRRRLAMQATGYPTRYVSRAAIALTVEGLFDRDVVLPRIAKPVQRTKAQEGAVAILVQLGRADLVRLRDVLLRSLATTEQWIIHVAAWSRSSASGNIQARWADLRALIAFVALTKTLVAAYRDRGGDALGDLQMDDRALDTYLDSCLDFCDELALNVEAVPWVEPPLGLAIATDSAEALRRTWTTFCETESPALEARRAFLAVLLPPP